MTIINFKIDEEKKKQIEEITEIKGYKSVSEFIRQVLDKEINFERKVEEYLRDNPPLERDKINIPEYIPDGKYLGIAKNEIVIIGDSAQEVSKKLAKKFPKSASGIIHKGYESENLEFIFSIFSIDQADCYHQYGHKGHYYPILPFNIYDKDKKIEYSGLIDTGATISALDKKIIQKLGLTPIKKQSLFTANGITEVNIYKSVIGYKDLKMELEFVETEISEKISFHALLGKNFIDKFNILLLGDHKLFCLQPISKL